MRHHLRIFCFAAMLCALALAFASGTRAATIPTILEMSLGNATTDVRFDGTNFFTVDESNSSIAGAQDTGVLFLNYLDPVHTDIPNSLGKFSLTGLAKSGQAILVANTTTVVQVFTGGSFTLYDDTSSLLLSGNLATSALTGAYNVSTGGLFTTSSVSLTGGSLLPYIDSSSFQLSMNFTSIERGPGQVGVALTPAPPSIPSGTNYLGDLLPFTADATVDAAAAAPEPSAIALVAICGGWIAMVRRRCR